MNIYQHFRPEEREFIDQVLQWKDTVENTYAPKLTDFLDPREQQIVLKLIGENHEVKFQLFGGMDKVERKRAIFFPDYFQVKEEDFQITLYEIQYPKKFVSIEHPQVLGSLMSLGLRRGKFGDILIDQQEERIQFFAAKEVSSYIEGQLESIGRASIQLKELAIEDSIEVGESWHELTTTASSLRLDTIVSAIYNLSRQKSQLFIQQGLVKVNWTTIENPAFEIGEADVISVRGHGRSKLTSIEGKTKKEKWRIVVGKQK